MTEYKVSQSNIYKIFIFSSRDHDDSTSTSWWDEIISMFAARSVVWWSQIEEKNNGKEGHGVNEKDGKTEKMTTFSRST